MKHPATIAFAFMGLTLLLSCDRGKAPPASTQPKKAEAVVKDDQQDSSIGKQASSDPTMILIPAGRFVMGDKDEIDASPHEVEVSSFYLDQYLVTQEKYQQVMGDNPSRWKGLKNPVEQVRWSDAVRYCNKRSEAEGLQLCYDLNTWECDFDADGYRLPTEAEWEYACRAGTTTAYFFGANPSNLTKYGWFERNAKGRPQAVGRKEPNPWGIYDICGNVWEWCNDYYQVDYYQQSPGKDPRGPTNGKSKVVRGGAWRFSAESCRSGFRYNENPGYADVCFGYDIYGFRCVRKTPKVAKYYCQRPPAKPWDFPSL